MNPVTYKEHFNPDIEVREAEVREAPDYEEWQVFVENDAPSDPYLADYTGKKDEFADVISYADEVIGRLREQYEFRDGIAVEAYVEENLSLFNPLMNTRDKIRKYFGSDTNAVLDLVKGFEAADDERLFVFVRTELSADEALDRLDELHEQWWLGELSMVQPKFSIDVEYV